MSRPQSKIFQRFGQNALSWFDRSYVTDWAAVLFIWLLSGLVSQTPVYERAFDIKDPLISHPHMKNQVGSVLNHLIALFVPLLVFCIVGSIKGSLVVIHHAAIGVCASRGLARLITVYLKHRIGRLRPDFLARCVWDELLQQCSGKVNDVVEGRRSFPSGHSSTAFSGMFFLSLWIAGQTAAWCFSIPKAPRSIRSGRLATFCLSFLPIFWATHVAVTRVEDYRHHKEDVIVGSLIGIASAVICYLVFWPSPFSPTSFTPEAQGLPRDLYPDADSPELSYADYELHPEGRLSETA